MNRAKCMDQRLGLHNSEYPELRSATIIDGVALSETVKALAWILPDATQMNVLGASQR